MNAPITLIDRVLECVIMLYHSVISPLQQYTVYVCNTYDNTVLLCYWTWSNWMRKCTANNIWYDTHFSLLEMHTDNSTNCTLLGPVDCDSFYKWIPLNRWPGCHLIRGIAFYLLCISLLYVHHIMHCLFTSLKMTEPVVKCECDGRVYFFFANLSGNTVVKNISKFSPAQFELLWK